MFGNLRRFALSGRLIGTVGDGFETITNKGRGTVMGECLAFKKPLSTPMRSNVCPISASSLCLRSPGNKLGVHKTSLSHLSSPSTASDHNAVAIHLLKERYLIRMESRLNAATPMPVKDILQQFRDEFRIVWDLQPFKKSLKLKHKTEPPFDKSLFVAATKAYSLLDGPEGSVHLEHVHTDDTKLVFSLTRGNKDQGSILMGLVRQRTTVNQLKPDHSVAIFQQKAKNEFNCTGLLSMVELKLQQSSGIKGFIINDDRTLVDPDFFVDHGAIAQQTFYVIQEVWPYLRGCGVERRRLPLAVLVGQRRNAPVEDEWRWALGELIPSEACCGLFQFGFSNFSTYTTGMNPGKDQDIEIERAVAAYLQTILFGFQAALDYYEQTALQTKEPLRCLPLSGSMLMIGNETLYPGTCKVLATSSSRSSSVKVSQGDLFEGRISLEQLQRLQEYSRNSNKYLWFCDPSRSLLGTCEVIIKASSLTVHPHVVNPFEAFAALRVAATDEKLKRILSKLLVMVVRQPAGVITVMHDMRSCGFQLLCPSSLLLTGHEPRRNLSKLWNAFCVLVDDELLPLAEKDLLHSDIRPGFDETSNILVKESDGSDDLKLMLIDLESLIELEQLSASWQHDGRYVPGTYAAVGGALNYLWWQCLAVAYVWSERLDQNKLRHDSQKIYTVFGKLRSDARLDVVPSTPLFRFLLSQEDMKEIVLDSHKDEVCLRLLLQRVGDFFSSSQSE